MAEGIEQTEPCGRRRKIGRRRSEEHFIPAQSQPDPLGRDLLLAGNAAEAVEHHHRQALAMSEEALAVDPNSEENNSDLAYTSRHLGRAQATMGEHAAALANLRRALAVRQASMAADPANARARQDVAGIYHDIANPLAQSGDASAAIEAFAQAIPPAEELARQSPSHASRI